MKLYLLVLLVFSSVFCYSQKKIELTSDSVSVKYFLEEDSLNVSEKIEVRNFSHQNVYIPDIKNRALYFYKLNSTLFSFFGVMAYKFGTPNLSMEIRLIKIPPKGEFEVSLKIPKDRETIKIYIFSFDYLREIDLDRSLTISMESYANLHKYAIGSFEDF